jgi:hypothetical protein
MRMSDHPMSGEPRKATAMMMSDHLRMTDHPMVDVLRDSSMLPMAPGFMVTGRGSIRRCGCEHKPDKHKRQKNAETPYGLLDHAVLLFSCELTSADLECRAELSGTFEALPKGGVSKIS